MSQTVQFPSNGDTASGYLATPTSGKGPGLLVVQEWWGLVPQLKGVCDRLADEGFVALAPDLYHGEIAEHTEMDKANELMQSLPPDRAARDMGAAIDYLLAHEATEGHRVGVIGFCMGGMLTLLIAALQGDKVAVATPFYGAPLGDMAPDWTNLTASVQGHFAEKDDFFPLEPVMQLEADLKAMGKDVEFIVYPGTGHAFANEQNPLGTHDSEAAKTALERAVTYLKSKLP
ncbi:MAG TPA: dienelactone hydrolase family protein [Mycobacteriales bacterium]|nr:dienelactone hydrolase family protein [Mycobacteriales bacterium]